MNKQIAALRTRSVQAAIMAMLLWAMRVLLNWPWLLFVVLAAIVYGLFCLGYAIFLWTIGKK
ncbi:hypothetical protein [Lacticaseibacillus hegangensis]|uniref:DUF2892 domain-containing protein n=1 Tax=Lacticaseibacillus hegangensis TaxID=2486010 RepID=A0ABW4D014_9LACO|nr:hypothetical protein [Lacticaseibacillus hegangensis]